MVSSYRWCESNIQFKMSFFDLSLEAPESMAPPSQVWLFVFSLSLSSRLLRQISQHPFTLESENV